MTKREQTIFWLHIKKCGGTSFRDSFSSFYRVSLPAFQHWADGATRYPVAERLAEGLLQLPVGSGVTPTAATRIGEIVAAAGRVFH